jgi:hypothetical protein
MDPLFGERAARFDAQKLNWLGSIGKLENICITWQGRPITRIEQTKTREVAVSASGAGGNSSIMPKILNQFLGTKFKVIGGYTEGSGTTLALERGEVDGVCGLSYSTLKTMHADWFRDRKVNVIVQIGLEKLRDLPDVPNALDLISSPEDKQVLQLILVRQEMGRPSRCPANVLAIASLILRAAFEATLKDPAFLADAAKLQWTSIRSPARKFKTCSRPPTARRGPSCSAQQRLCAEPRGQSVRLHRCRGRVGGMRAGQSAERGSRRARAAAGGRWEGQPSLHPHSARAWPDAQEAPVRLGL